MKGFWPRPQQLLFVQPATGFAPLFATLEGLTVENNDVETPDELKASRSRRFSTRTKSSVDSAPHVG